ncbi:MAG: hypothetical protein PHW04_07820 [Candidatus Wallbacteria bacterium]|nr:hypothetical protein [Candidatus Wallbacteria bacterium]
MKLHRLFSVFLFSTLLWNSLAVSALTGTIPLQTGWNLISLGLEPSSPSIEVIFAGVPAMKYVMGFFRSPSDSGVEGFRTYMNIDGLRDFSTLTVMDAFHGYWVYQTACGTLEITGLAISNSTEIILSPGWNLAGYWLQSDSRLPLTQEETGTVIDSVFNQTAANGTVKYIMGFYRTDLGAGDGFHTFMNNQAISFSTLFSLDPWHGYWFYMNDQADLKYGPDLAWELKILDWIAVSPDSISVGTDDVLDLQNLSVTAHYTDESQNPAFGSSWTVKSGSGAINGRNYLAPSTAGSAILLCSYTKGGITETAELSVSVFEKKRSLTVNLSPEDAILAGGRWSINGGGTWLSSGSVENLAKGTEYLITFKNVGYFTTPQSISGTITADTVVTGAYIFQDPYPSVAVTDINGTAVTMSTPAGDASAIDSIPAFEIPQYSSSVTQLFSTTFDTSGNTKSFSTAIQYVITGSVSRATVELSSLNYNVQTGMFSIPNDAKVYVSINQNGTVGAVNYDNLYEKIFTISEHKLNLNLTQPLLNSLNSMINGTVQSGRIYNFSLIIKNTYFYARGGRYNRVNGSIQYLPQ